MFGFFKKRVEVLNHWIAFADGFQMAPSEFYESLEKELSERKVPTMELSRIELAQGGLLSEKRVYLRMLRERIVFDVCAAPFGTGFFFSCRTAEIPLVMKLWELLAVILLAPPVAWFTLSFYVQIFGYTTGLFFLILTFALTLYILRNLVALGLSDLDRFLNQVPVLGILYVLFLRRETYFRSDSRLCYLHMIPTLVRKLAEDVTATQGIKLMEQFELSPVLGELYKPARREIVDLNILTDSPPLPTRPRLSM